MATEGRRRAEQFLREETQFQLGFLPTERPHPGTRGLAETLQGDTGEGVRLLLSVDRDVARAARRVFASDPFRELVDALRDTLGRGGRVFLSGCGATGRLCLLLEAAWRRHWLGSTAASSREVADRVQGIMTGGDYALVRSVESFEDFESFGRRQIREAGVRLGDLVVAISEGGETSSVIGSALQGIEDGAKAFFVFNNPSGILCERLDRSRRLINSPGATPLELFSGPMAVAGSTRMQATTFELLVVGSALEHALAGLVGSPEDPDESERTADRFESLLESLVADAGALAEAVELEESAYRSGGLVTYMADTALLDIFTDTAERAPTFMLPPFRKCDDEESDPPWAFVKNPLLPTPSAWREVFQREPRCLNWRPEDYRAMGAPERLVANPPRVGLAELEKFRIGCEPDPSRSASGHSLAMAALVGPEARTLLRPSHPWGRAYAVAAALFARRAVLTIGPDEAPDMAEGVRLAVRCHLAASPLGLWERLAAKLVFNTLSTAAMGRMGRLVSNWMAFVETTNKKLVDRGSRLVSEMTGLPYGEACVALHETLCEWENLPEPKHKTISPVAWTVERVGKPSGGGT